MRKKHERGGNWGGARPGAGRRRRARDVIPTPAVEPPPPESVDVVASEHAIAALAALVTQLKSGENEPAKIAAARMILDRGYGKPAVDVGAAAMLPFHAAPSSVSASSNVRFEARKYAWLAIEVLRTIAAAGASESARVAAARSLLDRGLGTVGTAKAARAVLPESNTQEDREQRARDDIIKRALARMQAKVN